MHSSPLSSSGLSWVIRPAGMRLRVYITSIHAQNKKRIGIYDKFIINEVLPADIHAVSTGMHNPLPVGQIKPPILLSGPRSRFLETQETSLE